jgi:hypothetical protein
MSPRLCKAWGTMSLRLCETLGVISLADLLQLGNKIARVIDVRGTRDSSGIELELEERIYGDGGGGSR